MPEKLYVVVPLWVYYSAQIFLFEAEFTHVYSHRFGSHKPANPSADGSL